MDDNYLTFLLIKVHTPINIENTLHQLEIKMKIMGKECIETDPAQQNMPLKV